MNKLSIEQRDWLVKELNLKGETVNETFGIKLAGYYYSTGKILTLTDVERILDEFTADNSSNRSTE